MCKVCNHKKVVDHIKKLIYYYIYISFIKTCQTKTFFLITSKLFYNYINKLETS